MHQYRQVETMCREAPHPLRAQPAVANGDNNVLIPVSKRDRLIETTKDRQREHALCKGFVPIVNRRGRPAVLVKFEAKLTPTRWRPHRPFRGWRYLDSKDAPTDLPKGARAKGMPPKMEAELRELGLL